MKASFKSSCWSISEGNLIVIPTVQTYQTGWFLINENKMTVKSV